jgi:hypothetical protein
MEHTLNNLLKFSSTDTTNPKHKKIQSFHYDHSGHVIASNSHVLFASKKPWEIEKAGKTFSKTEFEKGYFIESELDYPEWKEAMPQESGRKVTVKIPEWFDLLENENRSVSMILDYSDTSKPFIKIATTLDETCFAFNAKYLSCFSGEEVTILITGPLSPVVVVNKDSTIDPQSRNFKEDVLNEEWFYLLMPLKIDEEPPTEVYI